MINVANDPIEVRADEETWHPDRKIRPTAGLPFEGTARSAGYDIHITSARSAKYSNSAFAMFLPVTICELMVDNLNDDYAQS